MVLSEDSLCLGPLEIEAAEASARACEALTGASEQPLPTVIERCHAALRRTRGAVIALARFARSSSDMQWLAVGNVEGLLLHGSRRGADREAIVQRPGIVGHGLPGLMVSTLAVAVGDTLVFATDGLERGFGQALTSGRARPADGAGALLRRFATGTDDALLLQAHYVGEAT